MDSNSVEIDRKWRELRAGDLVNARLWLFEYYRDYSHYIAKSIYFRSKHAGFEMEDLIQWAEIGLLESIDRYNWERKVNFRTYAGFRIKGSVLNGMAKYSEKSSYYEFLSKLNADRFQFHLKSVNSVNGTLNELVGAILDFGYIHILENFWQLEETLEINSPYCTPEHSAFVSEIDGHISKLPKLSQKIIQMCYVEDKSFSEIAEILDLSKSRIAQLHRDALNRLRNRVRGRGDFSC